MKKLLFTIIFCGVTIFAQAQNKSVEKSIYGVQIGLGVWGYNESRLTNQIALRSELGFYGGYSKSLYYEIWAITPVITLEPRWYYNLDKRSKKGYDISDNSGNFLSLNMTYVPDWFSISNYGNVSAINQFLLVPTWGIRRNIGKNFNYETGIGLGYNFYLDNNIRSKGETYLNLHLRIGYKF